jgi:hypothetical protein
MATKKADNIFVRAKAYVKEHPRTSFQDDIQKVKGKISGVTIRKKAGLRKTATKPKRKQAVKRPRITGTVKVASKPELDKNMQLLKLGQIITGRIATKEAELKKVKDKDERRLLIGFINGEHDKLDSVIQQMKSK